MIHRGCKVMRIWHQEEWEISVPIARTTDLVLKPNRIAVLRESHKGAAEMTLSLADWARIGKERNQ